MTCLMFFAVEGKTEVSLKKWEENICHTVDRTTEYE